MLVSVIIPTWNRCEPLKEAIDSVLRQKEVPYELLVIDDGSQDGTRAMITAEYPEIRYFYFPNAGPAAARNRGIEQAHGEWLAFLDSDDRWQSGKLRAQLDFFQEHPDYRICQTEEIWIRNGARVNAMKKHKKFGGWIYDACLPLCIISPSAVMLQRDLLEEVGKFDESFPACEDYDLWLRISARYPVGLIPQPYVVKYGGHADQRSRQFPGMDQFRIQALVKILRSGVLNPDQTAATIAVLEAKSRIFIQGALKRAKFEEAQKMRELLDSVKIPVSNLL